MKVAVLGAGSWGTALAIAMAREGSEVRLWARDADQVRAMQREAVNTRYLPDAPFPTGLSVDDDLNAVLTHSNEVLVAVPSHAFRSSLQLAVPSWPKGAGCAWATKGFEPGTGRLLHDVAAEFFSVDTGRALVTGPSFAGEIASGLPAALTVASDDPALSARFSEALKGDRLRVYTSTDLIGAAVAGAVKNVLAIAAGIADGLHFGANARAALVARGLHEMSRLGIALGAQRDTFMGLAGLGDLVLTCTDNQSRNRRFGLAIGAGASTDDAVNQIGQVVEGISAASEVMRLARQHNIEMPICEQVAALLDGKATPTEAVSALFARDVIAETHV